MESRDVDRLFAMDDGAHHVLGAAAGADHRRPPHPGPAARHLRDVRRRSTGTVRHVYEITPSRVVYFHESVGTLAKAASPYTNQIATLIDFDAEGRIAYLSDYFKSTATFSQSRAGRRRSSRGAPGRSPCSPWAATAPSAPWPPRPSALVLDGSKIETPVAPPASAARTSAAKPVASSGTRTGRCRRAPSRWPRPRASAPSPTPGPLRRTCGRAWAGSRRASSVPSPGAPSAAPAWARGTRRP